MTGRPLFIDTGPLHHTSSLARAASMVRSCGSTHHDQQPHRFHLCLININPGRHSRCTPGHRQRSFIRSSYPLSRRMVCASQRFGVWSHALCQGVSWHRTSAHLSAVLGAIWVQDHHQGMDHLCCPSFQLCSLTVVLMFCRCWSQLQSSTFQSHASLSPGQSQLDGLIPRSSSCLSSGCFSSGTYSKASATSSQPPTSTHMPPQLACHHGQQRCFWLC